MSQDTNERVRLACEQLLIEGRDVTFTAVASGISRATCYLDFRPFGRVSREVHQLTG